MASCFFFSSRRRHTRWPRDWSSDVCSSDLDLVAVATRHGDGHEVLLRLSALGKSVELGCGFHSGHFIVAARGTVAKNRKKISPGQNRSARKKFSFGSKCRGKENTARSWRLPPFDTSERVGEVARHPRG